MPFVNHNGVKLFYETHGKGRALLLNHGFMGATDVWDAYVGPLSRHFQVIRWDMRGHGQSDYPEADDLYSERMFLADMRAVMTAADTRSAVLVGQGMGANLSLAFAIAYPRCVEGLVLDEPEVPPTDGTKGRLEFMGPSLADFYLGRGGYEPGLGFRLGRGPDIDPVMTRRHRHPWGISRTALKVMGAPDSLLKTRLKDITAPVIFTHGDGVDTHRDQVMALLREALPQAQKMAWPEKDSTASKEYAAIFTSAVIDFVASCPKIKTAPVGRAQSKHV